VEFGVLGSLEVVGRAGPAVVRGNKRRGLLAYLLLHMGETVSLDRLVEDLWGERAPAGARGTVQTYLSQLRKLLAHEEGVTLETRPGGYVLEVPVERLDATRFERLCVRAVAEPNVSTRLAMLDEALGLWRGAAFGEFAGSAWADVEATRLDSMRLEALQQRVDARLELGHHAGVIPELERLVGEYRLDERFWAQLMVAYYGTGRQGDALRAYQRVRSVLADELGIEPGDELVDLERKILDHDPALTAMPGSRGLVSSPAEPLPEGVVTFLLTDVEGSTPLWDAHPQATATAMARHEELITATVGAHRGHVVKARGEGDSTLSVFPRASDAAAAAVALRDVLAVEAWPEGLELRTRVAIHTGEAQLRGGDYYGGTLNRAARIRALAAGGEVLCSRATADLVADTLPSDVELREVGTYDLEGLRRAETVYALAPRIVSDSDHARPELKPPPAAGDAHLPLPARLRLEGVFVGRDRESAALATAFEAVRDDEGRRLVLVAGEPGVGKTTLAARFARAAHAKGAVVLYGHCDEGLGIPYQPWAETLAHLVRHAPEAVLGAHVAARGGELGRLAPDLAQRVRVPPLASTDPEADRYRLFGAVVDLLVRISNEAPVVLLLDDLHWADPPTLELVRHVVGAEAPVRLLLVATYRDTDIGDDHPLAATLAALHREPGMERIALSGLDPDSIGALLEAAAGHDLDADGRGLRDALAAETDGNPFFVTEILRHLVETDTLRPRDDGRWAPTTDAIPVSLPTTVREVIIQRVARLGDDARRLLTVASVIGRDFDVGLLTDVADADEAVVLDSLDMATAAALIRPAAGEADRYTFVHALVEHALFDALSPARRRRFHGRVAEWLEARCGTDPGDRIGELAYHWLEDGDQPDKAIDCASRAGARALAQLAPDDALHWYRQALDVLDRTSDPDDSRRGAVLTGLGDAQRQTGDPAHRETLLAAARLAEHLGDSELLARAVTTNSRGMLNAVGGVDAERLAALEAAHMASEGTATPARALVLATLAAELAFADRARMRRVAQEAIDLARRLGDDATLVTVITRLQAAVGSPDTLADRISLADESIAAAERTGDSVLRWYAAAMSYTPALESGDVEAFERQVDIVDRLAREIGQPFMRWISAIARSVREQLDGHLDRAEELATEAFEIGRDNGQPDALVFFAGALVGIRIDQGRIGELVGLAENPQDTPGVPGTRAVAALCYCDLDRRAEARALLDTDVSANFSGLPFDPMWTSFMSLYAHVAETLGDRRAAIQLVELLEPWREQIATSGAGIWGGSIAHPLGLVLATAGRHDEAEKAFAEAAAVHEHIGAPILLAQTRVDWARLLCQRDPERSRELARAAHTVAGDLGAGSIERSARELLDQLDVRERRAEA
jgi:DNA-binding SARP family transcriptional activator/class 3 adenylate cyclase/tetratricopeptide (TPR) repeat protein